MLFRSEFLSLRLILLQEITKSFPPSNLFSSFHLSSGNPGHVTALCIRMCSCLLTLLICQSRVCFRFNPFRRLFIHLPPYLLEVFMNIMYRLRKKLFKIIPFFFSKRRILFPANLSVSFSMRIGSAGFFLFFLLILLGEALHGSEI